MIYRVYTLADPTTFEIRYIGITKETLASRRSKHLTDARYGKHNHRANWIRSLLSKNLKPVIEELDKTDSYKELLTLEIYWISQFKTWGFDLVNATDGGEGSIGYKHSKESLVKLKQIANSRRKPKKKVMSKEEQYSLLANSLSVPVLQYDLEGNLVKHWKSRLEAAKSNNTSSSTIGHALKDSTRTAIRSYWRYLQGGVPSSKILVTLKKGNKLRLRVESIDGKVLLFDNSTSAQNTLNISYPTILKYLKTGKIYKDQYLFKEQTNESISRYLHR